MECEVSIRNLLVKGSYSDMAVLAISLISVLAVIIAILAMIAILVVIYLCWIFKRPPPPHQLPPPILMQPNLYHIDGWE